MVTRTLHARTYKWRTSGQTDTLHVLRVISMVPNLHHQRVHVHVHSNMAPIEDVLHETCDIPCMLTCDPIWETDLLAWFVPIELFITYHWNARFLAPNLVQLTLWLVVLFHSCSLQYVLSLCLGTKRICFGTILNIDSHVHVTIMLMIMPQVDMPPDC